MKVLQVNSSDIFGGAARAAYRLNGALRSVGVDAGMLVQRKFSDDLVVIGPKNAWEKGMGLARRQLDALPLRVRGQYTPFFSLSWIPSSTVAKINSLMPDIVHLHWVCEGLASIGSLGKLTAPVVWTMHDSWPFTGGCHVPHDCMAYRQQCGCCPVLQSNSPHDLSHWGWERKSRMLQHLHPVMVAPSRWLASCAAASSLMRDVRITVIPNGIDTECFKPMDRNFARNALGVEPGRQILLFSAIDGIRHRHKGFHLLQQALEVCARKKGFAESTILFIVGSAPPAQVPPLPIPVRFLGSLCDDATIALAYSAAVLFLAPSLLENFSTTVLESMSCGTPVVTFNAGGMADLVEHMETGYLASPYDCDDFARGMLWALDDDVRLARLAEHGRSKVVNNFALEVVSKRYLQLYEDVWAQSRL